MRIELLGLRMKVCLALHYEKTSLRQIAQELLLRLHALALPKEPG